MLFCSYEFILIFLPVAVVLVLGASALGRRDVAKLLLLGSSLVYYAWWNPKYVVLLVALILVNYAIGAELVRSRESSDAFARRRTLATVGILLNIFALGYYKYANFFLDVVNEVAGSQSHFAKVILPLGISFIVFQKIAFLVDAYSGQITELGFVDYALFVSFFPQLIAGPIVHHREVMPQFQSSRSLRFSSRMMALALSFFVIGLAKKILLADPLSALVAAGFGQNVSAAGADAATAWTSVLAYTLQVYFDFSGYSDMAIGLGLIFGVRLPFNFNSPLKAPSMIEFWSRWHMTLTRFLTAYVYNPIVLNATRKRLAEKKRITVRGVMPPAAFVRLLAIPTLVTMFIAGLWHGAGFQFIAYGGIHGVYLVCNHAWRNFRKARHEKSLVVTSQTPLRNAFVSRAVTLFALLVSMPFFRASSARSACRMVGAMFGSGGLLKPSTVANVAGFAQTARPSLQALLSALTKSQAPLLLPLLFLASQIFPNTQQILRVPLEAVAGPLARHAGEGKTMDLAKVSSWSWPRILWTPSAAWAVGLALLAWYSFIHLVAPTEFLYFQF